MADTPIITPEEYAILYGTGHDAKVELLVPAVQLAISNLSQRDFGKETVTEERSFLYQGGPIVDIDDCADITEVKINGRVIPEDYWEAMPQSSAAKWWLELSGIRQASPEMGFLSNWDTLGTPPEERVFVTATWGWPEIPADVKMAALWTINAWISVPGAFISESIEGFSRTVSLPSGLQDAIPARAQMILESYDRGPNV